MRIGQDEGIAPGRVEPGVMPIFDESFPNPVPDAAAAFQPALSGDILEGLEADEAMFQTG